MTSDPVPLTVLGPSTLENDWSHHGRGLGFLKAAGATGAAATLGIAAAVMPGLSIPWPGRGAILGGAVCLAALTGYLLTVSREGFRAAKLLAAETGRVRELLVGDTLEVHYFSGRVRTVDLATAVTQISTFNTESPPRHKCELITVDTDGEHIGLPLWDKPRPAMTNYGESLALQGPSIRKIDRDLGGLILALSQNPHPSAANAIDHLHSLMDTRPTWRGWVSGRRGFGQWLGDHLSH